jgi:hypothetical protein
MVAMHEMDQDLCELMRQAIVPKRKKKKDPTKDFHGGVLVGRR